MQTTYSGSYTGAGTVIMQRAQFQGTWGEWEWVNPHMIPGSEYRTTERWNGKAVYTQLINCGNMPNSQTKAVTTTVPVSAEIVSQKANATDGTFTSSYLSAKIYMGKGANNWIVYVESTGDDSASTLYLTVKYTKQ